MAARTIVVCPVHITLYYCHKCSSNVYGFIFYCCHLMSMDSYSIVANSRTTNDIKINTDPRSNQVIVRALREVI